MFEKPLYNFLYSLILVLITAFICSYFNRIGMQNFYSEINLSSLTPPNIVFPIVWTILYATLVIAFDMVLNHADKLKIRPAAQVFTLNMFLQALWTYVFFYNAYFLVGFAVLVVLDFVTFAMIKIFYNINKKAGLLLLPYMIWLLFATYLNWAVTNLNGATFN
ncbi:MAG: tryptophan-rich sensory protein [Alphaproteobacteria bacterium]|nr:tryptophan-rich sensory protein [Alphaproteobacteria bacterium]